MNARALSENLASLLRREHGALAEFLVALADFDRQRGWAALGHASLFAYLHRELRLSLGAAQHRKVAAELIQQVPAVAERLRSGELCLSSIIEAARVVTPDNWESVLPRFYRLSRREAAEVVAVLQPHPAPPARTVMTAVRPVSPKDTAPASLDFRPVPAGANGGPDHDTSGPSVTHVSGLTATDVTGVDPAQPVSPGETLAFAGPSRPCAPVAARRSAELVPLTASQNRLHVTVSAAFARKLEQARAARPDLSDEALLEAGLDLLLAQSAKRKGLVDRPRNTPPPSTTNHIPAHVKREVWTRDGGRCQSKLATGEICGSTHDLQFDHIMPQALGGPSTVENLRLACRPHNVEAARRVFGDAWMDRYCGKTRGRAARPAPSRQSPPAS